MDRDESEARDLFRQRYTTRQGEANVVVERAVIGADFGANGYTTRAQADRLAALLHLDPGGRLLDIGAGRGWPGLYLARISGCDVVLTDLPEEGLRDARGRAEVEGLGDRAAAVVTGGAQLPFRAAVFDGVVHTDVLC